jgi:hypothetical protein
MIKIILTDKSKMTFFQTTLMKGCLSSFSYYYQSVIVFSFSLSQYDHFKWLPIEFFVKNLN